MAHDLVNNFKRKSLFFLFSFNSEICIKQNSKQAIFLEILAIEKSLFELLKRDKEQKNKILMARNPMNNDIRKSFF